MSDPAEFGVVAGSGFFGYDAGSDKIVFQNGMRVDRVQFDTVAPGVRACQIRFDETLRQTAQNSLVLGSCEVVSDDPALDIDARLQIVNQPDPRVTLNIVLRTGAGVLLDWSALAVPGRIAGVSFVVLTGGTAQGVSA